MEEHLKYIRNILRKKWNELINYPNVLNINIGTKIIDGEEVPCIVVFVSKKKTPNELLMANEKMIPKEVEGVCTDVVEMSSTTFVLGKTSVSIKPFDIQRRLASGVIDLANKGDS